MGSRDQAIVVIALIVVVGFALATSVDDGNTSGSASLASALPPSPEACAQSREAFDTIIPATQGAMVNTAPGVLVVHPGGWATTSQQAKSGTVLMLAVQKACALGQNVDTVSVEVRSSTDNRLLGSGQRWNFEETD